MYLSRLTLKHSPDVAALQKVLNPAAAGARMDVHHRLIWSAFAGDPQAKRDFLWRDMGGGTFLVLSPRPPKDSVLFERLDTAPFAPDLAPGDRLAFILRANPTRTIKTERITPSGKRERQHNDLVMEALKPVARLRDLPSGEESRRAPLRLRLAQDVGRRWLDAQGERAGFRVLEAGVSAYDVVEMRSRDRRASKPMGPRFGVLDIEGLIEVGDPAAFLARLAQGFGRAKAFGCGLMLIRRV